jgi:hypothetical protein
MPADVMEKLRLLLELYQGVEEASTGSSPSSELSSAPDMGEIFPGESADHAAHQAKRGRTSRDDMSDEPQLKNAKAC